MLRPLYLTAAIMLAVSPMAYAQTDDEPVVWNFSLGVSGDVHAVLAQADVADGWYVYSQFVEDGGPIATSLDLSATPGIEMRGEPTEEGKALTGYDELFGMDITKFAKHASFSQGFALPQGATEVQASVEFMACTKVKCLPPRTVDVVLAVED